MYVHIYFWNDIGLKRMILEEEKDLFVKEKYLNKFQYARKTCLRAKIESFFERLP